MSTEPSPSTSSTVDQASARSLGQQIRRAADRAAREGRALDERQRAAVAEQGRLVHAGVKAARNKRLLGGLLGAFLLLTALNFAGLGFFGTSRATPWTEDSLDRYLREELLFEAENIVFFTEENGRTPYSLEEMGYSPTEGLSYERLGQDAYRISITDSGKSLTYDSSMDPMPFFGERLDD